MLTKEDLTKIHARIRAGASKKEACETEARRRDYTRWETEQKRKEAIRVAPVVTHAENQAVAVSLPPVDPVLTTKEYCEKMQTKVLQGILRALDAGEPWAYKEAVNILSKLIPEWKEKSTKKQIPLDAYQKILEKALKK